MDLKTLSALKPDYLRLQDPTEYFFVKQFVGGWDLWKTLNSSPELQALIGQWREELAQKLAAEAFSRILEASRGETREALGACKYVYETLTENKKSQVGRPAKEAIQREAHKLVEDDRLREEALNRLMNTNREVF